MLLELFLAGFVQPDESVQLRDLEDAALDESFDSCKTRPSIDGAEGLLVAVDEGIEGHILYLTDPGR